jgi:hypothetical protein
VIQQSVERNCTSLSEATSRRAERLVVLWRSITRTLNSLLQPKSQSSGLLCFLPQNFLISDEGIALLRLVRHSVNTYSDNKWGMRYEKSFYLILHCFAGTSAVRNWHFSVPIFYRFTEKQDSFWFYLFLCLYIFFQGTQAFRFVYRNI